MSKLLKWTREIAEIKLHCLVAATHTPFHDDGSLNLEAVEPQAKHLLKNNVTAVFIGGTTGESASLTVEERLSLAQKWFEVGAGLRIIVHVGANCLSDSKTLASQAEKLGAFAISAVAPSYFKPSSISVLIEFMAEVAGQAPKTPFYYYHIPGLTNVSFPMAEFLTQAKRNIPTLAGLKYSSQDLIAYQTCLQHEGTWDLPFGVDEIMLGALSFGAKGFVGSTYNFAAPIYHRLIAAFNANDLASARKEQYRSVQVVKLLDSYGYMAAAKATMNFLGVDVGPARLPNSRLSEQQIKSLHADLVKLGFFDWLQ